MSKTKRELSVKSQTLTVREMIQLVLKNSIVVDESYQVGTSEKSRWTIAEMIRFFISLITGMSISPIVLVDIKSCYEYWKKNDRDEESMLYFKKFLDDGYDYISVDGNNRTITMVDISKDKVKLQQGGYQLLNHSGPDIQVKKGKQYLSMLSDSLVAKFYDTIVKLELYTDISKKECGTVFRAINDGMGLNDHSKRQSNSSDLADFVRQMRKDFKKSLEKIFAPRNILLLKADEFIAKLLSYTTTKNFSKSTLDNIYDTPNETIDKLLTTRNKWFVRTLKAFFKEVESFKWTSPNSAFDCWATISDMQDEEIKIQSMKKYVSIYYKELEQLKIENKRYENPDVTKRASIPFLDYAGLLSKSMSLTTGVFRRSVIMSKIMSKLLDEEVITQLEDPTKRTFSQRQKSELWHKQDGICPETNKKIPIEELYNASLWQADHIVPFSKGGLTTIENGQLICATRNKQLGNKKK